MNSRIRSAFLAVIGALAAMWSPGSYASSGFGEAQFVQQPAVAALVIPDGSRIAGFMAPDGAMRGAYDNRGLRVEVQRRAAMLAMAGAATQDPVQKKKLFNGALSAIEWGFAHAGPDGSFPLQRGGTPEKAHAVFSKAMFMEAAARSLLMIRDGGADAQTQARANAILPALVKSTTWLAGSNDLKQLLSRVKLGNQRLFPALLIAEVGELTGNQAFKNLAKTIFQQTIEAMQRPDGTFSEGDGFDSNYQTVNLELLGRYLALLEPSPWRDYIRASLERGIDRMLKVVSADGAIDHSRNTRTTACKAPVPGTAAKGLDIDIIPLRFYYFGYLLGTQSKMDPLAQKVQERGQSFEHKESCEARAKRKGERDDPEEN